MSFVRKYFKYLISRRLVGVGENMNSTSVHVFRLLCGNVDCNKTIYYFTILLICFLYLINYFHLSGTVHLFTEIPVIFEKY